jgi:uncharacterized protein YjiS (DUF1127 family)
MPDIACARSRPRNRLLQAATLTSRLACAVVTAIQVRRERRHLLSLDERALKDMGFNRGQAACEASRRFWDVPADRLRM